jgi:hypothetical protein
MSMMERIEDAEMDQPTVSQIEESFSQLPISEQRRLIERLVHRVNEKILIDSQDLDDQLPLMAADPQIQTELQEIKSEFAVAESDGLEMA